MKHCIFIHIPRAAGASIVNYAKKYSPSFSDNMKEWGSDNQFVTLRHRSPKWILGTNKIDRQWWNTAVEFAVVRNPWDRLVSLYEYLRSFRLERSFRKSNQCLESFQSFVEKVTSNSSFVKPLGKSNVRDFSQANPQVEWLRCGVDKILRFENLEQEWKEFCLMVGFPIAPLSHKHKTKNRSDYRIYYKTDDMVQKVRHFYWEDIKQFGYDF